MAASRRCRDRSCPADDLCPPRPGRPPARPMPRGHPASSSGRRFGDVTEAWRRMAAALQTEASGSPSTGYDGSSSAGVPRWGSPREGAVRLRHPGQPQQRLDRVPGHRRRTVDLPFDRTPALGEAVSFGGRFVTKVVQVLWRLDGEIEINLKVHSGLKARPPSRASWWPTAGARCEGRLHRSRIDGRRGRAIHPLAHGRRPAHRDKPRRCGAGDDPRHQIATCPARVRGPAGRCRGAPLPRSVDRQAVTGTVDSADADRPCPRAWRARLPDHRSPRGPDHRLSCAAVGRRSRPRRYGDSPEGGSVIVTHQGKACAGQAADGIVARRNRARIDRLVEAFGRRPFHGREPPA